MRHLKHCINVFRLITPAFVEKTGSDKRAVFLKIASSFILKEKMQSSVYKNKIKRPGHNILLLNVPLDTQVELVGTHASYPAARAVRTNYETAVEACK